jgi:hypothetical protein
VVAHGGAEVAVLVHDRDALDGHPRVLGHLHHVAHREGGHRPRVGLHAEAVAEPALQHVVGHGGEQQERGLALLGDLAHRERDQAREGADQRGDPLVDEPRRLGVAELDLVLGVTRQEGDLRAAEGLDAARAVDLVDREEQPVERQLRLEGERAGHRQHVADLHLAGLGPSERGRGEGDGGGRAHRGEEAAAPDRRPPGISLVVRHRVLRTGIG